VPLSRPQAKAAAEAGDKLEATAAYKGRKTGAGEPHAVERKRCGGARGSFVRGSTFLGMGVRLDMFFIKNYNRNKLDINYFFMGSNVLYKE
jgi:hypothetical protein